MQMEVFIVSQHSVGVGHLSRSTALAQALVEQTGCKVTLFSGGKSVPGYAPPAGVRFIQLPAVERAEIGTMKFAVVGAGCSMEAIAAKRSSVLVEYFHKLRPAVIILEHYPFVPERYAGCLDVFLETVNTDQPDTVVISSVRSMPMGLTNTTAEEVNQALRIRFDHVLHHADPRVFPVNNLGSYVQTALSSIPVTQTGFVRRPISANVGGECSGLLLTVGGGRDGCSLLLEWIEAAKSACDDAVFPLRVVCGPLMPAEDRKLIRSQASEDVMVYEHVPDVTPLMLRSRAVVSMGGYNTINEAVSIEKPLLAFPRASSPEQTFQVQKYADKQLLLSGAPARSRSDIAQLMRELLVFKPAFKPDCNGAQRSAHIIQRLACVSAWPSLVNN